MKPEPAAAPLRVSLVAIPETSPGVLYGLMEVFAAVGVTWPALTGEKADGRRIDVRIVAGSRATFLGEAGVPIAPQAAFAEVVETDVVIVPDLYLTPDADPSGRWQDVGAWLHRQLAQGATVASVCSGSVLLAAVGLLDGCEATTHWGFADLFRRRFPAVRLRAERVLVPSGPEARIVTSGGAASWEDLALYLIARFCGPAEAVRTSKIFLFGDRSEGQLPYAVMTRPRHHSDAAVAACQTWIADHYDIENPVARMVARSGLAERSFKRRFKAATGYAPIDYVQRLRIEEAKHLLEVTEHPVDAIGREVGYEDPTFFRRLFKRQAGLTPAGYRKRFKSIARPVYNTPRSGVER